MAATKLGRWAFHQISDKDYVFTPDAGVRSGGEEDASVSLFVNRFGGRLSFDQKSVLDVGCGLGALCGEAARKGATNVVGVDLSVQRAESMAAERFPDLSDRVSFVATAGQLEELGGEQFDLVVSKDSMEHFPDPESFVHLMTRLVAPGGELAIGFSPLWKSPTGGHIDYMTKLPWAHLMFSEETIMAERRRFRPEEDADSFAEIKGGLNKMTLGRFRGLMESTGFEPVYFETNVSNRRALRLMGTIARLRPLREYFTQSVYGIWRNG